MSEVSEIVLAQLEKDIPPDHRIDLNEAPLEELFQNLRWRDRTTLLALIYSNNGDNKYLVGEKDNFPHSIARLLGGGLDPDETPLVGAIREGMEETGLQIDPAKMKELPPILIKARTPDGKYFATRIYSFRMLLTTDELHAMQAGDDVSNIVLLATKDMKNLIKRLQYLTKRTKGMNSTEQWKTFGFAYAKVHQIIMNDITK